MKKLFAILLAAILCLGLLAGCGQTTIIVNMGGEDDTPDAKVFRRMWDAWKPV